MRCKVGDLAVIIHDPDFNGRDVGAMVTVIEPGEEIGSWTVRAGRGRLAHWIDLNWFKLPIGRSKECEIPDEWLQPIRGDGARDRTEALERIERVKERM